jgi:hypothetical protein
MRGVVTAKVYLEVFAQYLPTILEHDSVFCKKMPLYTRPTSYSVLCRDGDRSHSLATIFAGLEPYRKLWKMLKRKSTEHVLSYRYG